MRHALAEVAGGRADEAVVLGSEAVEQVVGATTLERADWIGRLDLEHHCHTKPLAELFALVLRHVEEDGIDDGRGLTNSVDRDGGIHAGGLCQLDAPHPAAPPPTFPRGGELKWRRRPGGGVLSSPVKTPAVCKKVRPPLPTGRAWVQSL